MSDKTIEDVLRALHTQGITKVEREYSGGNDEGSFDRPVFYADDKSVTVDWAKTLDLDEDEVAELVEMFDKYDVFPYPDYEEGIDDEDDDYYDGFNEDEDY